MFAAALLAAINSPRLSESLWNDEIWSLEESVHGLWNRDLENSSAEEALTEVRWEELGWHHAIWRYDTTNHHFLLNLMAKSGNTAWQLTSDEVERSPGGSTFGLPQIDESWEFNESALRFLPFCCALGGLLAWAWLFARLGFPVAGTILPWLLALHPWYQQLATGMRGYALVFLFLPLVLGFLIQALRVGRWRTWLGFAVFQFLLIYSWPPAGGIMIVVNLCAAIAVWRSRSSPRPSSMKRLLVANLTTVMILAPLIAPAFYQIGSYLENEIVRENMGAAWRADLVSLFYLGSFWQEFTDYSLRAGGQVCGESILHRSPLLFWTVAGALLCSALRGVAECFRKNRFGATLFLIGFLLPPAASYIKAVTASGGEDVYIYHWYFVYALPALAGLAAIGLDGFASDVSRRFPERRYLRIALPLVFAGITLGLYAVLVAPRTIALRNNSVDPRKESVEAIRGTVPIDDPANAEILTVHVFRDALAYDPLGWKVKTTSNIGQPKGSPPGLVQLMSIADQRGLTLYVNVGLPSVAREKYPKIMEMVDDENLFVLHSEHFGLEKHFERSVFRYHGGIFSFDFSRPSS